MTKPDTNNFDSIRTYQAVKFDSKLNTFFTTEQTTQHRPVHMEIIPSVGVLIFNERDAAIVPFPNIGEIKLKTDYMEEKREAHKQDLSKPAIAQKVDKLIHKEKK